jgi:hypothetical protein
MSEFTVVPGHGKVRVGSSYTTTQPGKGKVTETAYEGPRMSVYERRRADVYATGNKWAIENFEATH